MSRPRTGSLARVAAFATLAGSVSGCADEEDLGVRSDIFGSIHIEVHRTQDSPTTPFVDTEKVTAKVTLGECLSDFYDANSEWTPEGSKGSHVADAWLDVLCDRMVFPDVFRCEPTGHEWLPGEGPGGRHQISVDFDALHPDLENFDIRVGPIAREGFAGCDPEVDVGFESADGFAGGKLVWRIDPVFSEMAWDGSATTTRTDDLEAARVWVERAD